MSSANPVTVSHSPRYSSGPFPPLAVAVAASDGSKDLGAVHPQPAAVLTASVANSWCIDGCPDGVFEPHAAALSRVGAGGEEVIVTV